MPLYPGPTAENLVCIPSILTVRKQWVLWQGQAKADHPGKSDKIPINPVSLQHASTTDALTWGTFQYCLDALPAALEEWEHRHRDGYTGGGIGYVLSVDDPFVGIDLDDCVDAVTGDIADWARAYITTLDSYTEVSQSATGIHILLEGVLPAGRRRTGSIEMYDQGRFFTVTGWHVPGTPTTIEQRTSQLHACWQQLFGHATSFHDTAAVQPPATPAMSDAQILMKAVRAKNANKFTMLWDGEWQQAGYPSQSEADLALLGLLRFWTQDAVVLDRLFRQSGLMRPKWDERHGAHTIGERTIACALSEPHESYAPPPELLVTQRGPIDAAHSLQFSPERHSESEEKKEPLLFTDVSDIWNKKYDPLRWLIEDLIPEGLTYLVGSQKSGKTYLSYSLALTLATSVISQKLWLDFYPILLDGPVFYLSLEDNESMFWHRIHQLMPTLHSFPKDRFFFRYDPLLPSLGEGLVEQLCHEVIKPYQPALLVIDPISYVSGLPPKVSRTMDYYMEFRKLMLPLRSMAAEGHTALVGVEHRRKQSVNDVDIFETQSGSNVKGAIADSSLVVVREAEDVTLRARVRNAGEQTITITFKFDEHKCVTMQYKGAHDGFLDPSNLGGLRMKVMETLMLMRQPMALTEIMMASEIPDSKQARNTISQILYRAVRAKELEKTERGKWVWNGGN